MTSNLKSMILGAACLIGALTFTSCSSEELGETLSVTFTTGSGGVIALTKNGTPETPEVPADNTKTPPVPAKPAVPATPDQYTGSLQIVAKVVYLGKKTLVYKWTYSLPYGVGGIGTVDKQTLSVALTGSSTIGIPLEIGSSAPFSSGEGDAILEVYEQDGFQYKKASTTFTIVRGFSG